MQEQIWRQKKAKKPSVHREVADMLRLVVLDQHREAAGVDLGALAECLLRNQVRAAVQDDLRRLGLAHAAVVQHIALGTDQLKPPAVKGIAAAAQGGQRFHRAAQPLLGGVPVKERPVEGVAVALHGNLIAVVDAGHTRQGKDHRIAQQQAADGTVHLAGRDAALALPVAVAAVAGLARNGGDGALGVVGREEVHRTVQRRGRVVLADLQDPVGYIRRVGAVQVIQCGAAEGIIHHGVKAVPAQVGAALAEGLLRGGVLPDLAQQQLVLAVGFDGSTDFFDKAVRQLIGHIEPETRGPQPQPGVNDTAFAADKIHIGGRILLHLRQCLKAPPAAVAAGIARVKVVPAAVGRAAVAVGTARAVAALAVEVDRVRAGVAEHAIENDADALFGSGGAKGAELLIRAQQRVGLEVVGRVVAVVGVGLKDRVQIQAGDAEITQIRQLLLDSREVAAVVVHVQVALALLGRPEVGLTGLVGAVDAVGEGHLLAGVALAEAVGEDLVHRAVFQPVGGLEVRLMHGQLPFLPLGPA